MQWSIYILNDMSCFIEVKLARVSFEWGDRGHYVAPGNTVGLQSGCATLLWREGWEGAEMNMEVSIEVRTSGQQAGLSFELGKLYRSREPTIISELGKPGWVHSPTQGGDA